MKNKPSMGPRGWPDVAKPAGRYTERIRTSRFTPGSLAGLLSFFSVLKENTIEKSESIFYVFLLKKVKSTSSRIKTQRVHIQTPTA
jgi:hypothetical protein